MLCDHQKYDFYVAVFAQWQSWKLDIYFQVSNMK